MYKNIIRGVINKKTGHALTINRGIIYTYDYNNARTQRGIIDLKYRPILLGHMPRVQVSIKEYLQ